MGIKFADSMMTSLFLLKANLLLLLWQKKASHATSNHNSMKPSCKQGDRLKKT